MVTLRDGRRDAAPKDTTDAVLRIPHPSRLMGCSLAVLAGVAVLSTVHQVRTDGTWDGSSTLTLAAAIAAALGALVLVSVHRAQTIAATIAGLVLLDLMPVALQAGAEVPSDARSGVLFLLVPTVVAAASVGSLAHAVHLGAAVALATVMVTVTPDARGALDRLVECGIAVGVLVAADLLVRRLSSATADRLFALRRLSLTDGLTGLLNRRGLAAGFSRVARAARRDDSIGMLVIDIDHFKHINDQYGHAAGDDILRRVCQVLVATTGPGTLVARLGGEEFAAVVVGRAEPVALAFTEALSSLQPRITVSIGIVDATHDDAVAHGGLWHLLDAADRALYEAKNTGRNRICRATVDAGGPIEIPATPVPAAAAVPEEAISAALPPSRLPGWALVAFSVLGLMSTAGHGPVPLADPLDWTFALLALACLPAGVLVVAIAPRPTVAWITAGVFAADALIALAVVQMPTLPAKLTALLPLVLTGLVAAQHGARMTVLAHHVAVAVICLLPVVGDLRLVGVAGCVLHATVLIGSAELISYLRRRHDAAASDLHRWSVTDPLTGLANRRGLELAFARMPRTHNITVLALDVDDFKTVNDRHGHAVGDDALIRLAATLRTVTGPGAVVGRTGGDEFVVLAPSTHAGHLTRTVTQAAALLPVPLSVSVGSTVVAPYHQLSLWQFVAAADGGLTRAKRARRVSESAAQRQGHHPEHTAPRVDAHTGPPRIPLVVRRLDDEADRERTSRRIPNGTDG